MFLLSGKWVIKMTYFDNLDKILQCELMKATKSIHAAVAWCSHRDIINTLELKQKQGVEIILLINDDQNNQEEYYTQLKAAGGTVVRFDSTKLMHHKFCIIDGVTVVAGSFNWTQHATSNLENLSVIIDAEDASRYESQLNKLLLENGFKPNKTLKKSHTKTANDKALLTIPTRFISVFRDCNYYERMLLLKICEYIDGLVRSYFTIFKKYNIGSPHIFFNLDPEIHISYRKLGFTSKKDLKSVNEALDSLLEISFHRSEQTADGWVRLDDVVFKLIERNTLGCKLSINPEAYDDFFTMIEGYVKIPKSLFKYSKCDNTLLTYSRIIYEIKRINISIKSYNRVACFKRSLPEIQQITGIASCGVYMDYFGDYKMSVKNAKFTRWNVKQEKYITDLFLDISRLFKEGKMDIGFSIKIDRFNGKTSGPPREIAVIPQLNNN